MEKTEQNCILFDWLTFTVKGVSLGCILPFLGLSTGLSFEDMPGLDGYRKRLFFEGISIMYDGRSDMGICVNLSGQGCRAFETYSSLSWDELFHTLVDGIDTLGVNVTRLDIAFDDHSGILDMDCLLDDMDDHNYTSRSSWWKVEYGSEGSTIYVGSPRSNFRLRIYDKAAERGYVESDHKHWIRVEMQLRKNNALSAIRNFLADDIGIVFGGILRNYVIFRVPGADSNRSRWEIAPYWDALIGASEAIHLWVNPGVDYNFFKLENWLVNTCGAAIRCYSDIVGIDNLFAAVRTKRLSPKYQALLDRLRDGGWI